MSGPDDELADLFGEARSPVVVVDGQEIWSLQRMEIESGATIRVTFESAAVTPVQGLRLGIDGGALRISGQELSEIVLWDDTLPGTIDALVIGDAPLVRVNVWNVWRTMVRSSTGQQVETTDAWLRNSGMLVERRPAGLLLRCSDGRGAVDFTDLVVRLEWTTP